MAKVTIYQSVVRAESRQVAEDIIREGLRYVAVHAAYEASSGTYATGRLASSIRWRGPTDRGGLYTGEVYSNLHYAAIVEHGARRHIIRPRGPWRLRFYWRKVGRNVAFRRVRHPGFRGKKWLLKPLIDYAARHSWIVYTRDF